MDMVSHQVMGIQGKSAELLTVGKTLKIFLTIFLFLKDGLPVNASEHHMKNATFALFPGIPWHISIPPAL
ncbi:MAG: hypothetical protein HFF05_03495 [Oscillospiraceae bacterium]|nr:hypothetical protein [Oscillospiraceae bacterium]